MNRHAEVRKKGELVAVIEQWKERGRKGRRQPMKRVHMLIKMIMLKKVLPLVPEHAEHAQIQTL